MSDWSTSLIGCIDSDTNKAKFFCFSCLFSSCCPCLAQGDIAKLVNQDYNVSCLGVFCAPCSVFLCWTPNRLAYISNNGIADKLPAQPQIQYAVVCCLGPCSSAQILTHENFKAGGAGAAMPSVVPTQLKM